MVGVDVNNASTPLNDDVETGIEALSVKENATAEGSKVSSSSTVNGSVCAPDKNANGEAPVAADEIQPGTNDEAVKDDKVVLTARAKEVVKSTVPVLKQYGSDIVLRFYHLLFERYPELRKQFNM